MYSNAKKNILKIIIIKFNYFFIVIIYMTTLNKSKKIKCKSNTKPLKIKGKTLCVGKCPHSGGPIVYDPDKDELLCAWHGSRFNIKNGKVLKGPSIRNLEII